MQTVQQTLEENRKSGRGSLVGYFPAGFPTVTESIAALVAMADNGCNILEVGIPYSDPVMDGPVIQRATEHALANGFRLKHVFEVIAGVREMTDVPMLVMSYWNPILRFGPREFAEQLKAAGGAGLITPDLIPDEASEWIAVSESLSLERVFLAAPSSSQNRVNEVVKKSKGFVYAVSTMGITGERENLDALARSVVSKVRSAGSVPTCVGVGVSTAEQVREVNDYADGAIVGTALIKAYETAGIEGLSAKVLELAEGLG